MDSSSWLHGGYTNTNTGNNGFMCGYAASSCTPADLQYREEEEQQFLISSQIHHHLNQISMSLNMDDEAVAYMPAASNGGAMDDLHDPVVDVDGLFVDPHHAAGGAVFPCSSSSDSLSLPSASLSCSPESSAQILTAPAAACGQCPEVSSHVPPLPPPAATSYDRHHHYSAGLHVPVPAAAMAQASSTTTTGAFKRYARHLGPRRPPKPGACGQRMIKTAMSVLSKMHAAARYNQQYYYQQQAASEASPAAPPTVNQLQHMISERKRREKLNDSFHALRTVLPPGAKKDKTSVLIRAREYVRSLESKVSELEAKNKSLESRLVGRDSGDGRRSASDCSEEKVQVEITRAAKEERSVEPSDVCTLKIVVRSPCNMTDVLLRTLQCLRDQIGDGVSLAAMSTSGGAAAAPLEANASSPPPAVLTLQIKSPGAGWEERQVKDAVAKVVADALTLPSSSAAPATH